MCVSTASAQDASDQPPSLPLAASSHSPVAVHGMVRNAATGEPLARAMVRIEGDASTGALTDGEGRFEIAGLTPGPQVFEVLKPGFIDRQPLAPGGGSTAIVSDDGRGSAHNVIVAAEMPEIEFSLAPACAIHGQVELSTGDSAQGIAVVLLEKKVDHGRAVWVVAGNTRTGSDGSYRFGGLADGVYALFTDPAMDTDQALSSGFVAVGSAARVAREGYASVFYPDAREQSGAAKIRVANGEQVQANFSLTLEPFHPVTATTSSSGGAAGAAADGAGIGFSAAVTDAQGHQLPYGARYDPATHTVQTLLPDGTYSLLLTSTARMRSFRFVAGDIIEAVPQSLTPQVGAVEFSVSGQAVSNLRIPLSSPRPATVQFNVLHSASATATAAPARDRTVTVTVTQAGGLFADGGENPLASGSEPGQIESSYVQPGRYWVHTRFEQKSLCEDSFNAGGANLSREPLVLNISGAGAPLDLTARDDCASLKLTLPAALAVLSAGEERFFTVYAVPDFDSTTSIEPVTLRPTSGASVTLEGLTPGAYHVFTFAGPVALEYRDREALAALPDPGTPITLSPGATANLVLEAPGH